MRRLMTFMIAIMMAVSGTVLAGDRPAFDKVDKNGDGEISTQEALDAGAPKEEVKAADSDGDGKLARGDWWQVEMDPDDNTT